LNVKVEGQGHSGQKNALWTPVTHRQRTNGMRWLQATSTSSGRDHSVDAGGDLGACVRFVFGKTSSVLVFYLFLFSDPCGILSWFASSFELMKI